MCLVTITITHRILHFNPQSFRQLCDFLEFYIPNPNFYYLRLYLIFPCDTRHRCRGRRWRDTQIKKSRKASLLHDSSLSLYSVGSGVTLLYASFFLRVEVLLLLPFDAFAPLLLCAPLLLLLFATLLPVELLAALEVLPLETCRP